MVKTMIKFQNFKSQFHSYNVRPTPHFLNACLSTHSSQERFSMASVEYEADLVAFSPCTSPYKVAMLLIKFFKEGALLCK